MASIPEGVDGDLLLMGNADEANVRAGLASPYGGFIELGVEGLLGVGLRCFETARAGGLALSLKTSSVYALSTLELVSQAIRTNPLLAAGEAADFVDICLGEAISNAVMHGNLDVPAHLRINSKGFQLFRQVMQERLADPVLACRRIEINVVPRGNGYISVLVSDQGRGFDLAEQLSRTVDCDAKRGRGLGLINRICSSLLTEDGGRTLVMTFAK
ncbi:ATP-binding protein [Paramagnetospirillum marisnigri]|uniref:ATP-binding protein n=1 Tax=Paramagnetospirillum marisnigri TaxID=1285242 RepID=UPI00155F81D4|nr:ATP-binding protein [Paramagnetospirillum marisnigri]